PNARKIYVQGSRDDLRVPMREIAQSPTRAGKNNLTAEENPPITVYDTSGAYSDPAVDIDVRRGLEGIRTPWILDRGDVEQLDDISSEYARRRASDPALTPVRFHRTRRPLRAMAGRRVTQMHYAKRGVITPEMEYIAI